MLEFSYKMYSWRRICVCRWWAMFHVNSIKHNIDVVSLISGFTGNQSCEQYVGRLLGAVEKLESMVVTGSNFATSASSSSWDLVKYDENDRYWKYNWTHLKMEMAVASAKIKPLSLIGWWRTILNTNMRGFFDKNKI